MKNTAYAILFFAIIVGCMILGDAYKYKYREQQTITVTGLGEQEFTSDMIVWRGWIVVDNPSVAQGYAQLEADKDKVLKFIESNGVKPEEMVFQFVDNYKNTEPLYQNGNYVGQRFTGYTLRQPFTIESTDVEAIENISREISALLAQGIQIESTQPDYYYSGLDGLKLELIGRATADARARAEEIASESGAKLRKVKSGRMGVFQITGANTNEEFSAGGNFNTSSKNKKARITIRLEYIVR